MIRAGPVGTRPARYGEEDFDEWNAYFFDEYEWCQKGRNMISHINISFDEEVIRSIQFGYLENGALVLSPTYGSSEGHSFRVVRLNEDEYVTGLSGVLRVRGGGDIRNLTFHTNRGNHGPIGCLDNKCASGSKIEIFPEIRDRREFGGFFGSYTDFRLTSIGIYMNPSIASSHTIASSSMVVKRENI